MHNNWTKILNQPVHSTSVGSTLVEVSGFSAGVASVEVGQAVGGASRCPHQTSWTAATSAGMEVAGGESCSPGGILERASASIGPARLVPDSEVKLSQLSCPPQFQCSQIGCLEMCQWVIVSQHHKLGTKQVASELFRHCPLQCQHLQIKTAVVGLIALCWTKAPACISHHPLGPIRLLLAQDGSKSSLAGISFQDEGLGEVSKGQYLSTGEGLLQLLEGLLVVLLSRGRQWVPAACSLPLHCSWLAGAGDRQLGHNSWQSDGSTLQIPGRTEALWWCEELATSGLLPSSRPGSSPPWLRWCVHGSWLPAAAADTSLDSTLSQCHKSSSRPSQDVGDGRQRVLRRSADHRGRPGGSWRGSLTWPHSSIAGM